MNQNPIDLNKFLRELNHTNIYFDKEQFGDFFEDAIKNSIQKISLEIKSQKEEYLKKEKSYDIKNLTPSSEKYHSAQEDLGDLSMYIGELEMQLTSISEMRIVHLYKSFELEIISILRKAYTINDKDAVEFHKWSILNNYIQSKNIKPSDYIGYIETDELRKVNNQIKHNGISLTKEVLKIKEFNGKSHISYEYINPFFERVKPRVINYLKEISTAVYNDLYKFDDSRLESICNDFKQRMDEKTLKKFIEKMK